VLASETLLSWLPPLSGLCSWVIQMPTSQLQLNTVSSWRKDLPIRSVMFVDKVD
jgi:hypothetical protein